MKGDTMKRICAILSLDEKTKIKIQNYRDLLTIRYGVSKKILYPHITIAHYISIDMEEIIKYTGDFVKEMNASFYCYLVCTDQQCYSHRKVIM